MPLYEMDPDIRICHNHMEDCLSICSLQSITLLRGYRIVDLNTTAAIAQNTPKRVRAAKSRNKDPPAYPRALSEIYLEAKAPPVTASSVARACPSTAPSETPAHIQLCDCSMHICKCTSTSLLLMLWISEEGHSKRDYTPSGECEAPRATVASIDRSPHSARKMMDPTCISATFRHTFGNTQTPACCTRSLP